MAVRASSVRVAGAVGGVLTGPARRGRSRICRGIVMVDGRVCECGQRVDDRRAGRHDRSSRWCSSWCEGRAAQGLPPEQPPPIRPAPVVGPDVAVSVSPQVRPRSVRSESARSVREAVARALEAAGLAGSWEAAQALDLAESLDSGGGSGSARAALHRELRAVMAGALRGVDEPGSQVGALRDEVAERRARRAGGSGVG
jgi:hypothetical protein